MERRLERMHEPISRVRQIIELSKEKPIKPEIIQEIPIYWVKFSDVNEEIFSDVLNIFFQVFQKDPQDAKSLPSFEDIYKPNGEGYADWEVFGRSTNVFEVRNKQGEDGTIYLRFKASTHGRLSSDEPGLAKNFQDALDEFLILENLQVSTSNTFK